MKRAAAFFWSMTWLLLAPACSSDAGATRPDAPTPPGITAPVTDPPKPIFLWRITDPRGAPGEVFVLGSVHLQPKVGAALNPAIVDVARTADELVFELLPGDASGPLSQIDLLTQGMLIDGSTLDEHLKPDTYALFVKARDRAGLPPEITDRMRPWLAALTLNMQEMDAASYAAEAGVERQVQAVANARAPVPAMTALETVDEQMGLFTSMSPEAQDAMVRDAAQSLLDGKGLAGLAEAYRSGDEARLEALILAEQDEDPALRPFFDAMYTARNARMTTRILPYFEKGQRTLVTVGAAHVIGADGIVQRLRDKGFVAQRVAPRAAPRRPPAPASSSVLGCDSPPPGPYAQHAEVFGPGPDSGCRGVRAHGRRGVGRSDAHRRERRGGGRAASFARCAGHFSRTGRPLRHPGAAGVFLGGVG